MPFADLNNPFNNLKKLQGYHFQLHEISLLNIEMKILFVSYKNYIAISLMNYYLKFSKKKPLRAVFLMVLMILTCVGLASIC